MIDIQLYERIEAYLNGTLEGLDLKAFEKQIGEDASVQKLVEQQRIANLLIKKNSFLRIKEMVAQEDKKANQKVRRNKMTAVIAATLLLVVGLASLLFLFNTKTKNKDSRPVPSSKRVTRTKEDFFVGSKEVINNPVKEIKKNSSMKETTTTDKSRIEPKEEMTLAVPLYPDTSKKSIFSTPSLLNESRQTEKLDTEKTFAVSPCVSSVISAHVQTTPSCTASPTGTLHVNGFKGGVAPYTYEIRSEGDAVPASSRLSSGKYQIVIKDSIGCTTTLENIVVKERDCESDYAFNPFMGEQWEVPLYPSKATLSIFDEFGNEYFRSEIGADEKFSWSGYSTKGELKTWFFPFVIKYQDGTSKAGSVTVGK